MIFTLKEGVIHEIKQLQMHVLSIMKKHNLKYESEKYYKDGARLSKCLCFLTMDLTNKMKTERVYIRRLKKENKLM